MESSQNPWRAIGTIALVSFFLAGSVMLGTEEKGNTVEPADDRILSALERLSDLPTSGILIERAKRAWSAQTVVQLGAHYKWGDSSRTDTILTRHLNTRTGKEDREREVTIYLREGETETETMMDMVHEMVHAISRPAFDPYDPMLTPEGYVMTSIEGDGGEVEAVSVECQVGFELTQRVPSQCRDYIKNRDARVEVDQEKIRNDFYRIGKWYTGFVKQNEIETRLLPLLSPQIPKFLSSTGHSPYPVALLQEFQEMTSVACQNSRNRILNLSAEGVEARFLAKRCMNES